MFLKSPKQPTTKIQFDLNNLKIFNLIYSSLTLWCQSFYFSKRAIQSYFRDPKYFD